MFHVKQCEKQKRIEIHIFKKVKIKNSAAGG